MRFRRRGRREADRSEVLHALLDTTLFVVTPEAPAAEGSRRTGEDEEFEVVTLPSEEGAVLPVFTSVERLGEFRPGAGYIGLPSEALFEMALTTGPARLLVDLDHTIGRSELEVLAQGRVPLGQAELVPVLTEIRVGRPAHSPPEEVLAAVRGAIANETNAVEAWLFLMQRGESTPELVVGVVLADTVTGDSEAAVMKTIVAAAARAAPGADELLFTRLDEEMRAALREGAGECLHREAPPSPSS